MTAIRRTGCFSCFFFSFCLPFLTFPLLFLSSFLLFVLLCKSCLFVRKDHFSMEIRVVIDQFQISFPLLFLSFLARSMLWFALFLLSVLNSLPFSHFLPSRRLRLLWSVNRTLLLYVIQTLTDNELLQYVKRRLLGLWNFVLPPLELRSVISIVGGHSLLPLPPRLPPPLPPPLLPFPHFEWLDNWLAICWTIRLHLVAFPHMTRPGSCALLLLPLPFPLRFLLLARLILLHLHFLLPPRTLRLFALIPFLVPLPSRCRHHLWWSTTQTLCLSRTPFLTMQLLLLLFEAGRFSSRLLQKQPASIFTPLLRVAHLTPLILASMRMRRNRMSMVRIWRIRTTCLGRMRKGCQQNKEQREKEEAMWSLPSLCLHLRHSFLGLLFILIAFLALVNQGQFVKPSSTQNHHHLHLGLRLNCMIFPNIRNLIFSTNYMPIGLHLHFRGLLFLVVLESPAALVGRSWGLCLS